MADNVTQQTAMPNGTAKMSQIPELCPHAELNVRPGMLHSPLTNRTPTTKPKTKLTIALNVVDTCMTPNAAVNPPPRSEATREPQAVRLRRSGSTAG